MKIAILYGTETGNAEMVADDLMTALVADHEVTVSNLSTIDPATGLDPDVFYVIVCSTYGEGELPQSARPFAARLSETAPDLSGVRFAMLGLGDEEYEATFNHGSAQLAENLKARGAQQLGERLTHNASGADLAEEIALRWITTILADLDEAA